MEAAASSPSPRPGSTPRKDPNRSRITNGSALLLGVDQRSPWVRRCRDVIALHLSDLGGADFVSEAERSIVRRAAVITVELENIECRFATEGKASAADLDLYSRAAANLRRLLESVGLKRVPRPVTTLEDYLRSAPVQADDDDDNAEAPA